MAVLRGMRRGVRICCFIGGFRVRWIFFGGSMDLIFFFDCRFVFRWVLFFDLFR